jgi:transcriptional regulator with XRE-family HTH domain
MSSDTVSPEQCRAARALLNLTLEEFSTKCGLSARTLTNFEMGTTAPRETTTKILLEAFQELGIVFVAVAGAPGGVIRMR